VLTFCPICGCGPLEPVLADKTVYALLRNGHCSIEKLQAYSCGPNGHILIVSTEETGTLHATNGAAVALSHQRRVLNSWKEIASYMGRGVRTVQRWEQDLCLPVHRPKGTNRSAVVAFPEELDQWLHQTPLRDRASGNGSNQESGMSEGLQSDEAVPSEVSKTLPIVVPDRGPRRRPVV
jgi:hypothetical protein